MHVCIYVCINVYSKSLTCTNLHLSSFNRSSFDTLDKHIISTDKQTATVFIYFIDLFTNICDEPSAYNHFLITFLPLNNTTEYYKNLKIDYYQCF